MKDISYAVSDIVIAVREGFSLDEQVDSYINTSDYATHVDILEAFGDVDLSEPMPDLSKGWQAVRAQLAYNALYQEAAKRLKTP